MTWVFLVCAILAEVAATLSLRMVSRSGGKKWITPVLSGYLAAFGFLALALNGGLALGVAYGIWAASGVALIAIASSVLFHEPLSKVMGTGIGLIVVGVLLLELGVTY